MKKYIIRYRVITTKHGGFLWRKSSLFPVLDIRYRKEGSKRWIHLGNAEIDLYTYHRFKNTYYMDFEKRMTDMMTLETRSDYERMELFMDILRTEFDGSIAKLVESIVREKVIMDIASKEEREDANRITNSLVTTGFRTMGVYA